MPNIPMYLNVPTANGSKLPMCLAGMTLAKLKGFKGVRCSAGLSNMPYSNAKNLDTVDVSGITAAVNKAADLGLKVRFLLNVGIKRGTVVNGVHQSLIVTALNGGVIWPVPNLPWVSCTSAVRNWVWDVAIQQIVKAARDAAIAKGKTTDMLEFECLNEPGQGGNQQPWDVDPLTNAKTMTTYPGLAGGTIVEDFARMLAHGIPRVNWYGARVIVINLEGQQGADQVNEVNSVTGSNWTAALAAGDTIGTNCYMPLAPFPYNPLTYLDACGTKLSAQLGLINANPLLEPLEKVVGEIGLDRRRVPRCQHPNRIRQDIIDHFMPYPVWAETQLESMAFFTAFNTQADEYYFNAWNDDGSPIVVDGYAIDLNALEVAP